MKIKHFVFFVLPFLVICFSAFHLNAQVHADFTYTVNPASRCPPVTVIFHNFSSGATSYSWTFGNGNTSLLANPSASYTAGTYAVKLVATASNGSTDDTTISITIFTKPVANFTTSTMPSCIGQVVTFTDNTVAGSAALSSWAWDFGDGNTQNTVVGTITHIYTTPGVNRPVSMGVTDGNGCSHDTIVKVTIAAAPVASFTGSSVSSCAPPLSTVFTNTSTTSGTATYLWKFGDGTTSTQSTPPAHSYSSFGSYTVTLIVTQGGCKDSTVKNNFVSITNNTVANFSGAPSSSCVGQAVTFTDQSTPVTGTQSWDFGDGITSTLTNPVHSYTTAGTYNVVLVEGTVGCQNTITKNSYITVSQSPIASFGTIDTLSCIFPFAVHFNNNSSSGANYSWTFGDGFTSGAQSPIHSYLAAGAFTVTLTVTSGNGCSMTLTKTNYIVVSKPIASFTATPLKGCTPLLVNFTSTSNSNFDSVVSYKWNFGDGSPIVNVASPGTSHTYSLGSFNVKLVVQTAFGCKDSITKIKYIKTGTQPHPAFSIADSTVCFGTPAVFADHSTGADSAFWRFDANEGTFSSAPGATMPFNATNLFPDTGTFYVRQIVYNNGCADSLQLNNIVTILPPKPIFSFVLNCTNYYSVNFTDESIGADSIVWNFGDGTGLVSDVAHPVHVFATRGAKTVTLTAYNAATGCFSSIFQTFTIAQPKAWFYTTPKIGCYPLNLTVTDTSQDANTHLWSFGDGSGNFSINFSPFPYIYFVPKLDTIKLIVTDINGCKDSAKHVVTVYGPTPNFKANLTTGCAPFPVTLSDSTVSDSTLVLWTWNFGDGSPSQTLTTPGINHTYATPGFYNVKMTVKDKNGCRDSLTKNQYIQPTYPFPAFVTDTFACRYESVIFDASSTNAVAPATYAWIFGDGNTGTGSFTSHDYTSDNLYTVTLTVTDVNGCDSSIQHQIRIQHPHAAFTDSVPLIGCGVTQMHYRDLSTGLSITGWQWDFGDGATSLQENAHHNYTIPGPYTVTLITTNIAGCKDTIADSVFVPGPTGKFTFTPNIGCPPLTVTFTAVSSTATSYTWDFGDGTVIPNSPNATIQHTYTQDRIAIPILYLNSILPNGNACTIQAPTAGVVTVKTIVPHDSLFSNITAGCYPLTVNFFDASTVPAGIPGDSINSWKWNFGDNGSSTNSSTLKSPSHVYKTPGTYSVTLYVTTFGGCKGDSSMAPYNITVHPHPTAAFKVNLTNFNLPYDALICTNQSTGSITYNWNFGDGSTSTMVNPEYLYSSVGTQQIQLVATSQFGCTDTVYKKVVTNSDVIYPNAFTPNSTGPTDGAYTLFSTDNDVFFPYTYGVVEYQLEIFNRWGEKVFESIDIKRGWDGYYKGKLCDQGVYIWKAYVKLNNGKEFYKNGDVTLMR